MSDSLKAHAREDRDFIYNQSVPAKNVALKDVIVIKPISHVHVSSVSLVVDRYVELII